MVYLLVPREFVPRELAPRDLLVLKDFPRDEGATESFETVLDTEEVLDEVFDDVIAETPDESWTSAVRMQTIAGSPSIIFCHVFPSSREPKICPFLVPR